ncbi:MAG TPA: hypothetical protein VGW36_05300 [Pyrinomonadaceae bacterium]|nr:hypothetical protein [Pyrinomonadaceae bacterium]
MAATATQLRTNSAPARFFPGDLVEVLSEAEILATLDDKGTLEKLPFMPEMLAYCGGTFRVSRQAFKTCVDDQEMRQLENTVFLEEVRCNGGAHGGCDRACLMFWKEAWLKPKGTLSPSNGFHVPKVNTSDLLGLAQRDGQIFCQSSEILNASKPLPWWEPKQYLWDLKYNRTPFMQFVRSLFIAFYNKVAHVCRLRSWKFVSGPGMEDSSAQSLNLRPGELVRVKSLAQIKQTLDAAGKNQNLLFAPTMMSFCGQVMKVQDRVENIVLEATPRQRKIKDTVLLEGATCDGVCHRLCPRQSFLFWRECWLERVPQS